MFWYFRLPASAIVFTNVFAHGPPTKIRFFVVFSASPIALSSLPRAVVIGVASLYVVVVPPTVMSLPIAITPLSCVSGTFRTTLSDFALSLMLSTLTPYAV